MKKDTSHARRNLHWYDGVSAPTPHRHAFVLVQITTAQGARTIFFIKFILKSVLGHMRPKAVGPSCNYKSYITNLSTACRACPVQHIFEQTRPIGCPNKADRHADRMPTCSLASPIRHWRHAHIICAPALSAGPRQLPLRPAWRRPLRRADRAPPPQCAVAAVRARAERRRRHAACAAPRRAY